LLGAGAAGADALDGDAVAGETDVLEWPGLPVVVETGRVAFSFSAILPRLSEVVPVV
jgi:hypothetical protein